MSEHQYKGRSSGRRPYSRPGRKYSNNNSQGQRNRKYNNSGQKRNKPGKKPVSFWKKLLAFFGIGKTASVQPKKKDKTPVKTNTRIARSQEPRQKKSPKLPVSVPRLYVGNLSYEATEADLEDLFKGVGSVNSVEIIYNPRTHKSKGYGFIEMRCMEDAYRAVEVLHDQPFMGRDLTVSAANERDLEKEDTSYSSPVTKEQTFSLAEETTPVVEETVTPLLASSEETIAVAEEEKKEEVNA